MNSNIFWFLLLFVIVTVAVNWNKKDIGLPSLIAVVLLFSVVEVATNYPLIWRDVYLHGSSVQGIIGQGTIANTWNQYPSTQPGFFLLWSMVTQVTGLNLVASNLLLLLPVAIVMLAILMILINRRLSVSMGNAAVLFAFLLMNFNTNEFTFTNFNTRLLSMLYVLLFFALFSRKIGTTRDARASTLSLIVVFGALVMSHALSSLLPVVFLVIYWFFERKRNDLNLSLVLCCASIYVVWSISFGYPVLESGLTSFFKLLYVNSAINIASGWSPLATSAAKPLFGTILGTFYKGLLAILALVSIYAFFKLRNQKNVRTFAYYLLAIALVYGFAFFSVLRDASINRGILFISFGFASLSMILLTLNEAKSSHFFRRARHAIVIIFVLALIVPMFVLVHEPPIARNERVGSLDSTCNFLVKYRSNQTIVSLYDFPIYYCFYEPFYKGYITLGLNGLNVPALDNITSFLLAGPTSSLKVVDNKVVVDWGLEHLKSYNESLEQWNMEVYPELDSKLDRIYSNGFDTIFR